MYKKTQDALRPAPSGAVSGGVGGLPPTYKEKKNVEEKKKGPMMGKGPEEVAKSGMLADYF